MSSPIDDSNAKCSEIVLQLRNRNMTRTTASAPRRSQKSTANSKKKKVSRNGDIREVEDVSLTAPSSSGSEPEPLPPNSEDSSSGVKSVAAGDESSEEVEEVEVVKKKASAKKRKKIGKADDEEEDGKCVFPMNRIKMIAKSEGGDDMRLSHEAIFLLNKASEKFLELLCEEAYAETVNESKNYVAYHHLSASVSKEQRLCFLSDLIPVKITAEEALRESQLPNSAPTNN